MKILLTPFMYLAGLGLIISFMLHAASLLGLPIPLDVYGKLIFFFFLLLLIAFVPAALVMGNHCKDVKSRDIWKVALRGCPTLLKYLLYLFCGYAGIRFVLFAIIGKDQTGVNGQLTTSAINIISAFFMVFYSVSLAILYSAIQNGGQARRCPNGHPVSPTAKFCGECGLEVINP